MIKKELLSYFKTFFITFFIIFAISILITLVAKDKSEQIPSSLELKEYKENQIDYLIEKYKYQEKQHSKNFMINIQLGLLYENTAKLKEAEQEYKKAIDNSPYGNFEATFLLASLYVEESKFPQALYLVDNIREYPDPYLISSKAIFYSKIAKKLYEKQKYPDSIRQYLNSYYYQEKNDFHKTDVLKDIPKPYSALANQYLKQNQFDKAVRVLEEGIRFTKSPELMYQLGLTVMNVSPEKSLTLFEYVELEDPTIIDYAKYNHLLMLLIRKAEKDSDDVLLQSYIQKLKLITRFDENNIIHLDDFELKLVDKKYHKLPLELLEYVDFDFVIRNNTSYDVSKLYAKIKIYNNHRLIKEVEKRVATTGDVIRRGRNSSIIHVKVYFSEDDDFIITDNVKVVVSIKRNERLKRTFLGEISIPKIER